MKESFCVYDDLSNLRKESTTEAWKSNVRDFQGRM